VSKELTQYKQRLVGIDFQLKDLRKDITSNEIYADKLDTKG